MECFLAVLHDWQDLVGAIFGGLLGVVGALIVARGVLNRERRSTAVMLQRDLLNVTRMVRSLTYRRKVKLTEVGSENLLKRLVPYYDRLSPLFEQRMAVTSNYSIRLMALLDGFYAAYTAFEGCLNAIRVHKDPMHPALERELRKLPVLLDYADQYAQAALYFLPLYEIGTLRSLYWRLRRRCWPDQHDNDSRALIAQLEKTGPPTEALEEP